MRRFLEPVIVVTLLLGTGLWLQRLIATPPLSPPPIREPERSVAPPLAAVRIEDVPRTLLGLGDLHPLRRTLLRAEVGGVLQRVHVPEIGREVKPDDLLFEIQQDDYEVARREASAREEAARATVRRHQIALREAGLELVAAGERLEVAERDVPRFEKLRDDGLATPQSLERARMNVLEQRARQLAKQREIAVMDQDLAVARAQEKVAAAVRERAERNLAKTYLRAPYGGRIARREVERGDLLSAGQVLGEVQDASVLKASFPVPSSRIQQLAFGAPARISVPDVERTYRGAVAEISPAAAVSERTFVVTVHFENDAERPVAPGHFCQVEIELEPLRQQLTIPESALVYSRGQHFAYALDEEESRLHLVPVEIAEVVAERAVLKSGLRAGERVASGSLDLLFDGALYGLPAPAAGGQPEQVASEPP